MKHRYYIAVPIIFGFISGLFLYGIGDDKEVLLSRENLIKNGSPMIGDPSAPITILEWGDYQCTYCYQFHESSLNTILDEYINSGKVNLVFKDFPLNGPDSVLAAEAAYCADDQGKYWEYHDELYTNWGGERIGRDIGIDATPSFLVFNDEKIIKIRGNQPIDVFRKAIDDL